MILGYYNKSVILTYIGAASAVLGMVLSFSGALKLAVLCLIVSGKGVRDTDRFSYRYGELCGISRCAFCRYGQYCVVSYPDIYNLPACGYNETGLFQRIRFYLSGN